MKLSIVIPVYNEKDTVTILVERVVNTLGHLPDKIKDWEIVMVDDGSKDGTPKILKDNYEQNDRFKLFLNTINRGKGSALKQAFNETTGDIVLVQDADLEYDPNDYFTLLRPILEDKADVVYGSRFRGEITRVLYYWHYLGNKFLTMFSNMLTNINLTDMETCYKVFKGPLIRNMKLTSKRFGIEPEMTAKISKLKELRIYEVPISYYGRTYEEGKKIGWKDGVSALWCIFKFNILTSLSESFYEVKKEREISKS